MALSAEEYKKILSRIDELNQELDEMRSQFEKLQKREGRPVIEVINDIGNRPATFEH